MKTLLGRSLVLSMLLAACLVGCAEDASQKPAPVATETGADGETTSEVEAAPPEQAPVDGEAGTVDPPSPPDPEQVKAAHEQRLAEMDEYGRGLLDSFKRRVGNPPRDAGLRRGKATIHARVGDVEATFHATFDHARAEDERVAVEADPDNADVPKGTIEQIRKWARIAFEGPNREVVHYLPPTQLLLTPSRDGKNRVVTAQPHKHNLQVSYSVDDRDMVMIRGTSVIPRAEIVRFEWQEWRGRQLLKGMTFEGTETNVSFEYDDKHERSAVLMKRGRLTQGAKVFDAAFRYEGLEFDE